jgi:hypothetical protein
MQHSPSRPALPDSLLRMAVGTRLLLVALPLLALWLAVGWALDWSFQG